MKLLLDTHAFIWWTSDPSRLSKRALAFCEDPENQLVLSVVSLWEMQIKAQMGKLVLRGSLSEIIEAQQQRNQVEIIPITLDHVLALDSLPPLHGDPFDRLLIAQARIEGASVLTKDEMIPRYSVDVVW